METLVLDYGYFGVFLVLFLSNASIFFPLPGVFIIFFAGAILNPLWVAVAGGLGAAIGEFIGYLVGYGGGKLVRRKTSFRTVHNTFRRYGYWTIYVFAALPLPFDVVGILSGMLSVNRIVFFVLTFAGKTTAYSLYAFTGRGIAAVVLGLFHGRIDPVALGFIAIAVGLFGAAFLYWRHVVSRASAGE
jgi:membrane protein DedA with SNARE-associated domain